MASARPLFAERGFNRASFRDIARAAGANPTAVSHYFGGKEGLYRAVLEEAWGELERHFDGLLSEQPEPMAKIENFVRGLFAFHAENPFMIRFINREMADPRRGGGGRSLPFPGRWKKRSRAAAGTIEVTEVNVSAKGSGPSQGSVQAGGSG